MKYLKYIIIIFVIISFFMCIEIYIKTKPLRDIKEHENILNEYIKTYI